MDHLNHVQPITPELIARFLAANRQRTLNIHVVGDAMVDEYFEVEVNRISPEFPMPIMSSKSGTPQVRPGGAANVTYQLQHFNVMRELVCFYDPHLVSACSACRVPIITDPTFEVTVPRKRRFLDHGIQVNRWDVEPPNYGFGLDTKPLEQMPERLIQHVNTTQFRNVDVAILSDYNKGFFVGESPQKWINYYKGKCLTIVDPKKGPTSKWKGCDVLKLNHKEAAELTGLASIEEQCIYLQEVIDCTVVIITHGAKGVYFYFLGQLSFYENQAVLAESVIGAGDSFGSVLALAMGHDFSVVESVQLACNASSIYVQNSMNRPLVPAELMPTKIVHPADLRSRDFKLVFTNGCFDLLHKGHLEMLKFAKAAGDKLVVAINSDDSVKMLKGAGRPINTLVDRQKVLAALETVDFVTSFDESTPYEAIKACMPDVLVKGGDYRSKTIVGSDIVPKVLVSPYLSNASTTQIINRLKTD